MLKSNDRWVSSDIKSIAEYCITSGVSASLTQKSRELFNEFMIKSVLESYPKEGTVSILFNFKFFSSTKYKIKYLTKDLRILL
jgi:hypothetical protein